MNNVEGATGRGWKGGRGRESTRKAWKSGNNLASAKNSRGCSVLRRPFRTPYSVGTAPTP